MKTTDSLMPSQEIVVPLPGVSLGGELNLPSTTSALVLFAHGSGSSRHSPRNQFVARALERHGLGTLLIDLLTADEDAEDRRTAGLRFDIGLLSERLVAMIDWLDAEPATSSLRLGLFGA